MRIAFTTSDGRTIDQHFGMTERFSVWEVDAETAQPVGEVIALTTSTDEEDRISARASAIADCAIVYTVRIGGPAAAKLIARRVHPMKTGEELPIADAIARLQGVLRHGAPPWLRKAMRAEAPPPTDETAES